MAEAEPPRLSAVIACYNDALAIPLMHERLTKVLTSLAVDYEIIFVNDGSPDETDAVLKDLTAKDPRVLAVEHSRNFGSQSAFVSGMQIATGDAVILLDGDLQDPPEIIAAFYEKWREGHEVVYGRRAKRETSALLALAYKAFYRLFRRFSYVPIPLDAGDFSLMDRKVVNALLALPETDLFVRGLRAWVGFRQTGVDYLRPQRPFGKSHNGWLKNLWWARKGFFSFSFAPVELLGYAGATVTGLAFLGLAYQLIDCVRHPEAPHGFPIVIALVVFFGALNLLAIGVIGEYLIRVFEEAKRRPRFIRRAIRQGTRQIAAEEDIERFLQKREGEWRRLREH